MRLHQRQEGEGRKTLLTQRRSGAQAVRVPQPTSDQVSDQSSEASEEPLGSPSPSNGSSRL